jgi:2-polyprenyl-3-methyl-5-hydroxy-6-metoxy-1,4-benzoquinol methylase
MPDDYQEFPCDVCGSTEAIEVPRVREYAHGQVIHICKKCGLIYTKMRRSFERIADAWSKELFGDPKVLSPTNYSAKNPHVKSRLTYFAEFIDTHLGVKGKKVCDIGAGEGLFLDYVRSGGAEVFGIEPSEKNCALMTQASIPHFKGTIEQYAAHAQKTGDPYRADIATMSFTLECTQKPRVMLDIAHSILKDGGHVAIHMGSRFLVPFKKPIFNYFSAAPADTHPLHLSFNTLKGLLAGSGFEIIHHNPYVENDNLCVIAKKMPAGSKIDWKGDDYLKVADFIERWHKESLHYR